MMQKGPIGIFDSGYGGLTVLKEIAGLLPEYDYLYLGDNARTPYGTRSFETIYEYTLECVKYLFDQGCHLVILACNTASAQALRKIQQEDLPYIDAHRRVLGVIRPTAEMIGNYTKSGSVGVLGTNGTIKSESYLIEIEKQFPKLQVYQQACPMWVPLIENGETKDGADYFVQKYLREIMNQCKNIDTLLLACTHYPLLVERIRAYSPDNVQILAQGEVVAESLKDYLYRHPEIKKKCTTSGTQSFLTTDSDAQAFENNAKTFFGQTVKAQTVHFLRTACNTNKEEGSRSTHNKNYPTEGTHHGRSKKPTIPNKKLKTIG